MQRITKESEIEEVMMSMGIGPNEKLRESTRRKTNLEKFAQLRSRNPHATLNLKNVRSALVKADEERGEFIDIIISNREFEQKNSDLPSKYHDYIMQKALTSHEVGHILYSSWPELDKLYDMVKNAERAKEGVDSNEIHIYESMFADFFNLIEDGCIERYLAQDYRIGEELAHMRSTIHEDTRMGVQYPNEDGSFQYYYPFFQAVQEASLCIGVYDSGALDKLKDDSNDNYLIADFETDINERLFFDECVPKLEEEIPKIQKETDCAKRYNLIFKLWEDIRKYLNRSTTSGKKEHEIGEGSGGYLEDAPENMSEGHGEQVKMPLDIENVSESQGDRMKTSAENGRGELTEKAKQKVLNEANESNDWSDELEDIIDSLGAGDGIDEIAIAEDGTVNNKRMKQAENLSRRTERIFSRRLRKLRKQKTISNQERGIFDSRAMIPAERGSTRCFKKIKPAGDKDYKCMIVLDRSGSMNTIIKDVELAAGSIAWGLEENGVDTSIIDTHSSMTTLSKPFGTKTSDFQKKIFAGRCGGGTPLSDTVNFGRKRLKRGRGKIPFMIIITDGSPFDRSKFKSEISKANFPVLGIYLTNEKENVQDQLSLYNKAVVCDSSDDINQVLINLINKIIF